MKEILTPDNFVFFQGEAHYIYRKRLNPLFTRRALSIYLPRMEEITRQHINKWFKELEEPKAFYEYARDFTVRTSLSVFCGNHIPEVQKLFLISSLERCCGDLSQLFPSHKIFTTCQLPVGFARNQSMESHSSSKENCSSLH